VPLGWLLGCVVALADVIRPKKETTNRSGSAGQF
jgi:hypothetical protein